MPSRRLPTLTFVLLFGVSSAAPAEVTQAVSEPGLSNRSDVVLFSDFESENWWQAWGCKAAPRNSSLVEHETAWGGKGKVLRIEVPENSTGGTSFGYYFQRMLGAAQEEMYIRYYVKFDPNLAHAVDGGKMPGFSGPLGKGGNGGRPVDGHNGWSARGHFGKPKGTVDEGFYCYHADMKGQYGSVWKFKNPLELGRWYCVEKYIKMNTPGENGGEGQKNGILRGWLDGELAVERTDVRFRHSPDLKIEQVWFNIYHGGMRPTPKALHFYFDNFVIARERIGVRQAQPAPLPPAAKTIAIAAKPPAPAKPAPLVAIDPAPHREALRKVLATAPVKPGASAWLNLFGQRQKVGVLKLDEQGVTVRLEGNSLPMPWKLAEDEDLVRLTQACAAEDPAALFHSAALAAALSNQTLLSSLEDELARLDQGRFMALQDLLNLSR